MLLAACAAPSEHEVRAEFADFIHAHNACETGTDCALIPQVARSAARSQSMLTAPPRRKSKARDLIEDYESAGRACGYRCQQPDPPTCEAKHCAPGPAE
jgi:hypothetical protein